MVRWLWPLLCVFLLASPFAYAGEKDAELEEHLEGLSGKAALELVKVLAADTMKGRKTAFEGGALVENWMLEKMSEFGLHPADAAGTYLEPFTYGASQTVAPIALTVGGTKLTYAGDYFDLTYTGSGKVAAEAVFVGYGIARPDLGWDDYAGVNVKGKVVIAIRGAPAARAAEFEEERFIGYKSATAADKGAAGFLLVQDEGASSGTIQNRFRRAALPALWLSGKAFDRILAGKHTTLAELKKSRDEGTPGKSFATGAQVSMEVHAKHVPAAKGHNALGAIKGRDPDLKDEIILVGAHMDHLGVGPDGQVFNGADDNASGTAVLIHLADVLTRNRLRPKRTIIFCGFGAEEQGLFGSKALAARYPFQGRVVCVLNMDMVGQGEAIVRVNGGGSYPEIQTLIDDALPEDVKKLARFGLRTGAGSDHWPFYERGVPAFGISTKGKHPNYHTPKDDTANIDPQCLEAAARVVGAIVIKLAMHEDPLHHEDSFGAFLLHEGPRFGTQGFHDGRVAHMSAGSEKPVAFDPRRHAHAVGLSAMVVTIAEDADPAQAWKALEALEAPEDAPYRLVRRAADVGRAWREGRIALLPRICCAQLAGRSPSSLSKLRKLGYRLVAPWISGTAKTLAATKSEGILRLCKKAGLLPDLAGLGVAQWGAATKALHGHPAVLFTDAETFATHGHLHKLLGPSILPVFADGDGPALLAALAPAPEQAQPVFLQNAGAPPVTALTKWGSKQPAGWGLPGSAERKNVRATLGGRLVEWLAQAER